jgi:hypothetical protein
VSGELYPPAGPYGTGYLDVGDGHPLDREVRVSPTGRCRSGARPPMDQAGHPTDR